MSNERPDTPSRLTGYLMVMTGSILFGINGNLSRLLFDEGVSPLTLVEFRMFIGGVCLLIVLLVGQRKGLKVHRRDYIWIVLFGLSLALVTYAYFVAISLLPLAVALVIQFSATAWMALGEAIWRRRMPTIYVLTALVLTFSGIILITGVWRQNLNGLNTLGLLVAGLSVLAYIAYLLLGRRIGQNLPSLTSTTYGAFVAALFWFIIQPPWSVPASTWSIHRVVLIILVGIIGMAIPFSLVMGSLRRVDATRVGIVSMLELVAAGLIAYFWLNQRLDLSQIIGCVLVMIGIAILQTEKPQIKAIE